MLQIIREKAQGIVAWVIVVVIGSIFIIGALGDFFASNKGNTVAAVVNGEKITWDAVEKFYERLRQEQGELVSNSHSKEAEKRLRNEARQELIKRQAMVSGSIHQGFRISDAQVLQVLTKDIPAFQVDGKFSEDKYTEVLSQAYYNFSAHKGSTAFKRAFEKDLQQGMLLGQLQQAILYTSFSLPSEIKQLIKLLEQKRDFGYFVLSVGNFKKALHPTVSELEAYYNANVDQFRVPERVKLEYVKLSLKPLMEAVSVKQDALQLFYKEHPALYTSPEKVNARHILLNWPKDGSGDDKKAITAKAQNILTELKNGASFAEIAKKESQDSGSAQEGGELGFFEKGDMIKEFEQAAFALKEPGEISSLVETKYGIHVIQLIEHKNKNVKPFEEVKQIVEEQYRRSQAEPILAEQSEELAKLAFENPHNLQSIVERLGLQIEETESFDRYGNEGITRNPAVIKAAFSDEVLVHKHNSELIPLNSESYAVVRLKQYKPAIIPTFDKVEVKVKEHYINLTALEKCKEQAEMLLERVEKGEKSEALAKEFNAEWKVEKAIARTNQHINPKILQAAFTLKRPPEVNKPSATVVDLPTGDYAILTLLKIKEGVISEVEPAALDAYKQSLTNVKGELEYYLYANDLFKTAKIKLAD